MADSDEKKLLDAYADAGFVKARDLNVRTYADTAIIVAAYINTGATFALANAVASVNETLKKNFGV